MSHKVELSLLNSSIVKPAIVDAFRKLQPQIQMKNPVMFVVYIGSILTSALTLQAYVSKGEAPAGFILAVSPTAHREAETAKAHRG